MTGAATVDIVHGRPVRVSDRVRRITAGNRGLMTGPGTNTYLVGDAQIAVVDPGPDDADHVDAILEACGDRLTWIIVTHTHADHSPAAAALARATGAVVLGNTLSEDDGHQDRTFNPARALAHDECLSAAGFTLRAIHTPGHVDNHVCFLVEEDGLLLTGDHIMQGSTVVIIPPYGDMQAYIESLRRLLYYPISALGPGHGLVIDTPAREIEGLIAHRLSRETKVVDSLHAAGGATLESLLPRVYDDVDACLHVLAKYSLLAHLIKLEKEQRAVRDGEQWIPV